MKVFFSRHGNTFDSTSPATWVGSKNDLPLVASGIEQAKNLAKAIGQSGVVIDAIYCGPLQRTLNYANIIVNELNLNLNPIIDLRLNELDYGLWSGLTSQEIIDKFGKDELEGWEKYCKWPINSGWENSEIIVREQVLHFSNDLIKKHSEVEKILVISSNGKLRYFLSLIPNEFERHISDNIIKIKTGSTCGLTYSDGKWLLDYWNKVPDKQLLS